MKWIILLGFVVAFCAGGVVGLRVRPRLSLPHTRNRG